MDLSGPTVIGAQRVEGGNFNRTAAWKTDEHRTEHRRRAWLDTLLQAHFQRADDKKPLLWYHFCAHPVCYQDTQAGPDWLGIVADRIRPEPGFLQGHIGDVNPGDGTKWIGDPMQTAEAIAPALHRAMGHGDMVEIDALRIVNGAVELPFDMERFRADIDMYKTQPEKCVDGVGGRGLGQSVNELARSGRERASYSVRRRGAAWPLVVCFIRELYSSTGTLAPPRKR